MGARGEGVQFSSYLGFAPQAVTIRASGTKTRNFKKRKRVNHLRRNHSLC
jgi:hypothetical protein